MYWNSDGAWGVGGSNTVGGSGTGGGGGYYGGGSGCLKVLVVEAVILLQVQLT